MNMCIHGTISTGVETLRARVEYNMARGAGEFCSEWKLSDFGNDEFVQIGHMIGDVLDGLAENPDDNSAVEARVREQVRSLCRAFPIYK